jgi:glycosyltransferase involved in cell wall biosynthesis
VRRDVPGYVEELPVVSATPETVRDVLVELIEDPARRRELGEQGREFALKWHSAPAAARRFDQIYSELLETK